MSNNNGFSEALFRTVKFRPGYPAEGFASLSAAREWMQAFVHWYNTEHRHSALRYVTPVQRHSGQAIAILTHRLAVYEHAKQQHPERWAGGIRDFSLPKTVQLNPDNTAAGF